MPSHRKKTRRKQKGGRRIGGGSYGVAFRPSLPCVGRGRVPNMISKVVSRETQDDEWRRSRIVDRIPAIAQFVAYPTAQCDLNRPAVNAANRFDLVEMFQFRNNQGIYPMLLSPDGGDSLYDIVLQANQYSPLIESMANVFHGLWVLHMNHIVHRDIKLANIVTRQQPDGEFITKLMDVGLLTYSNRVVENTQEDIDHNIVSVFNPVENNIYNEPTYYMPFDLTLMYSGDGYFRYSAIPFSLNNLRANYDTWVEQQRIWSGVIPFRMFNTHRRIIYPIPQFDDLITLLNTPGSVYRRHSPADIELIFRAADIWMLGFTMLELWSKLTHQAVMSTVGQTGVVRNRVYMMRRKFRAELGDSDLDILTLGNKLIERRQEGLIPQDTLDWYVSIANNITLRWHNICLLMIHPNPVRRIDLVDAAGRFNALLPIIRRHFSGPDVQQHLIALRILPPAAAGAVAVVAVENLPAAGGGGGGAQGGGGRSQKTRRSRK